MTHVITTTNVNQAFGMGVHHLLNKGAEEQSRNGPVLVAPGPVLTEYHNPLERILFSPLRDANPFFHFMESLWMLAGRNDVEFVKFFNTRMDKFSDDGKVMHGAYGYRWINHFKLDQLKLIMAELLNKPDSRRCVLQMWDCQTDLGGDGRDLPCNTQCYFDVRGNKLNMTVCNRSNDVVWGAYGANVVHFSVLQEYIACALQISVGVYRQFSNNFHAYTETFNKEVLRALAEDATTSDYYELETARPYPLMQGTPDGFQDSLRLFMEDPLTFRAYQEPIFERVAAPMYAAWNERKQKRGNGLRFAAQIEAPDWRMACCNWILRREEKKQ